MSSKIIYGHYLPQDQFFRIQWDKIHIACKILFETDFSVQMQKLLNTILDLDFQDIELLFEALMPAMILMYIVYFVLML